MKHHVTQRSRRTFETSPHSEAPGPQASAFAPPAYGIDFADRGMPAPAPVQCFGQLEEERGIQEPFATSVAAPVTARPAPAPNRTGLPDRLKVGIESLSGLDLSDVRVHSNSDKPAQFNALAYAQGTDIHIAPGQDRHLPHEAWHVVQQAQGSVRPTRQMKDGIEINDDCGLEREAYVMGAKAVQMKGETRLRPNSAAAGQRRFPKPSALQSHFMPPTIARKPSTVIQRSVGFEFQTSWKVSKADKKKAPFNKYDAIYTGENWSMEAERPSEGKSDVEFVVKPPFPENTGGLTTLRARHAEHAEFLPLPNRGRGRAQQNSSGRQGESVCGCGAEKRCGIQIGGCI